MAERNIEDIRQRRLARLSQSLSNSQADNGAEDDTTKPKLPSLDLAAINSSKPILSSSVSGVDPDSGIENMDIDESATDKLTGIARKASSKSLPNLDLMTEDSILDSLCQILLLKYDLNSNKANHMYFPNLENIVKDSMKDGDWDELCSYILMEVLLSIYSNDENPLRRLSCNLTDSSSCNSRWLFHPRFGPTDGLTCGNMAALMYLIDCWDRDNGDTVATRPFSTAMRHQLLLHSALVACGEFSANVLGPGDQSPLQTFLLSQNLPRNWLAQLLKTLHSTARDKFVVLAQRLLRGLHYEARHLNLETDDFRQPLEALEELLEVIDDRGSRIVADVMVNLPEWLPQPKSYVRNGAGIELERLSYFGPFLSLSPFATDSVHVVNTFFANEKLSHGDDEIKLAFKTIQNSLDYAREKQYKLVYAVLCDPSSRICMLNWLTAAVKNNCARAHIHFEAEEQAGDGFLLNLQSVLWKLAKVIRVERIDPFYPLHPDCQLNMQDETMLNTDKEHFLLWKQELQQAGAFEAAPKFNSQCFFLTAWAHHLGVVAVWRAYQRRLRVLRETDRVIAELEQAESQWKTSSNAAQHRARLARLKEYISRQKRAKLAQEAGLAHECMLRDALDFYELQALYMLRQMKKNTMNDSLPESLPREVGWLPEFFLENHADFLILVITYWPRTLTNSSLAYTNTVSLFLVIMCNSHYLRNPYLVAKLVEVLFLSCDPRHPHVQVLHESFTSHELAVHCLVPKLIKFYADVECTGAASEFYDKFSIRYHLAIIFKSVWDMNMFKYNFIKEASDGQHFVRFVNVLINDATYLLDESLNCLKRIREVQDAIDNAQEWARLSSEDQMSKRQQLVTDERQVRSYLTLASETVDMFQYMTLDIREPFMRPELADRLAAMLNFNLQQLCGPKCNSLKVRNPSNYGWEPKRLLDHLTNIYLHLDSPQFSDAIAADERSYSPGLFRDALGRMTRAAIKSNAQLEAFKSLSDRVARVVEQRRGDDEDFADAPEEFLDSMMYTIMSDPVQLPGSGIVMDRAHILRHLLNNQTDPFNRQPLNQADLVAMPELRQRIVQWKAARRKQSRS